MGKPPYCLGQPKVTEGCFGFPGTNGETIQPTLRYLRERGILPILNYAAESDVGEADGDGKAFTSLSEEAALDRQQRVFMRSIADCDNTRPSRGFVGIKVNPYEPLFHSSHSLAWKRAGAAANHDKTPSGRDLLGARSQAGSADSV